MEEKKSKRQEMDAGGIIASMYTQTWFVNIYPAFQIDKVKFSFVLKGTSGKDSFDIYADPMAIKIWADDIMSGRFYKILAAEKQSGQTYPEYYKFVTGEKGAKHVGIMNSQNTGYVINGKTFVNGKNKYANVPVDDKWLRTFADWYLCVLSTSCWMTNHAKAIIKSSEAFRNTLDVEDQEKTDEGQEKILHCEMYGEVKEHNSEMRSVAIRDISTGNSIGRLYVKNRPDFFMNGECNIKALQKGDNYLLI